MHYSVYIDIYTYTRFIYGGGTNVNTWKSATRLSLMELKASWLQLLLFIPFFSFLYSLFFAATMENYLFDQQGYIVFDFVFLGIILLVPVWYRSKFFQIQKVHGEFWASPPLIMQMQLPINEKAIARAGLLTYGFISVTSNIVVFVLTYSLSAALRSVVQPLDMFMFALTWILLGLALGLIFPASDVGDTINKTTVTRGFVMLFGIFIIFMIGLFMILDGGIIYASMIFIKNYPIIAILISLLLAFISSRYWTNYMVKHMRTVDYF